MLIARLTKPMFLSRYFSSTGTVHQQKQSCRGLALAAPVLLKRLLRVMDCAEKMLKARSSLLHASFITVCGGAWSFA